MRVRHESDNPEFVVSAIVETMQELKAKDVVSLDLRDIHSAVTDYFVICHAQSKTQVSAIADRILDSLRDNHRVKPYHYLIMHMTGIPATWEDTRRENG